MRPIKFGLVMIAAAAVSGCLSADTLISVNADGTGTIDQTVLINQSAIGMISAMGAEAGGQAPSIDQMFSETSLRETAGKLGQGVRYVSSQPVEVGGMKGVKAVYAFDDVTKLRVNESPSMPGMGGSQDEPRQPPMKFDLRKQAGGAALTITMPQSEPSAQQAEPAPGMPSQIPPEAMGMMQMMLKGMKVRVDVQVNGRIIRTDAAHHTDTRVTLFEVDMDALMQDPAALQALQGRVRPGASAEEMQAALRGMKGVKVSGPVVNIEWR